MPFLEFENMKIEVDEDGFMEHPELWNLDIARALASTEDITDISQEHWGVINYLREYFSENGIAPMIRKLCKDTACPLKRMYELFPSGPAKGACKVAGLSKPTGCV